MSRSIALLLAALLFGLVFVVGATEQNNVSSNTDQQARDLQTVFVNIISQVLLVLGLVAYCGFAALHSTQHLDSPRERTVWLIATVGLNVVGSCLYYLTVYQSLRKAGKGRLMRFRKAGHV